MSRDDSGVDAPPDAPAPDVAGFDYPLSAVRAIYERHRAGEALTFVDGIKVAYAIAERLRDDLDQVSCGKDGEEECAVAEELVQLTGMAYHVACLPAVAESSDEDTYAEDPLGGSMSP